MQKHQAEPRIFIYFTELSRTIRNGPHVKRRINDKTAKKIEAMIRG